MPQDAIDGSHEPTLGGRFGNQKGGGSLQHYDMRRSLRPSRQGRNERDSRGPTSNDHDPLVGVKAAVVVVVVVAAAAPVA